MGGVGAFCLTFELAEGLGLDTGDFRKDLERSGVTGQALLEAVLQRVAPYAAMLADILGFFAGAGARASSGNLRIHFDFGDAAGDATFDLQNFRDWESQFHETLARVSVDGERSGAAVAAAARVSCATGKTSPCSPP